jgi:hypothetical protein
MTAVKSLLLCALLAVVPAVPALAQADSRPAESVQPAAPPAGPSSVPSSPAPAAEAEPPPAVVASESKDIRPAQGSGLLENGNSMLGIHAPRK